MDIFQSGLGQSGGGLVTVALPGSLNNSMDIFQSDLGQSGGGLVTVALPGSLG